MEENKLRGTFKNGVLYVEDIGSINLPMFKKTTNTNIIERQVDMDCKDSLILTGFNESDICIGKTNIKHIDNNMPTKTLGGGIGKLDVCVINNQDIRMLIENKVPSVSIDTALNEAIYYCDGLIDKNVSRVLIAVGFNGKEVKWKVRVLDESSNSKYCWKPFVINGKECSTFPTPEILNLIYSYSGIHAIQEDRADKSKRMLIECINTLKQKYRLLSFIQNDNYTAIDFTIAFISMKSISEKFGNLLPSQTYLWQNLPHDNLKENIKNFVNYICDENSRKQDSRMNQTIDLAKNFRSVFIQELNNRVFDFQALIGQFRDASILLEIYNAIDRLPMLHSSKIDLFGETYEQLADKRTKSAFGQFFTGRHIIKPFVKLLLEGENEISISGGIEHGKAKNPKKICDPACGTGGFLTEAFKYVANLFQNSIDVNDFASKAIYGYDIFPENVTKSKINLYLAGDGFSAMESLDSLSNLLTGMFDYIITNPPYGDGRCALDTNIINNNRLEVNFIIKIVNLLNKGGKALIIVPDGILEAPSLSILREWIIKQCTIDKIIGLPIFSFAPYTKEKTYALFVTKRDSPLNDIFETVSNYERIWYYIVDNDGFANSDKRFPTKKQDVDGKFMHDELSDYVDQDGNQRNCILFQRWKKREQSPDEKFYNEFGIEIKGKKYGYINLQDIYADGVSTYNIMPPKKVIKTISDLLGIKIKKHEELFDNKGELLDDVKQILLNNQIELDCNNNFISISSNKVNRLLNLLPEKYFRAIQIESMHYCDVKTIVDNISSKSEEIFSDIYQLCVSYDVDELKAKLLKLLSELQSVKNVSIKPDNSSGFKVRDIFDHKQGHQITDEELYNSCGKIKVISGADATIKGYTINSYVNECDLPCLSYQTKGNNNLIIHIQKELFNANNTAVLIPKPNWRNYVLLDYIIPKLVKNMSQIKNSDSGVSYIDTRILDTIIELPMKNNMVDLEQQSDIIKILSKLKIIESRLNFMINDCTTRFN